MRTVQFWNILNVTAETVVEIAKKLGATDLSFKVVEGTKPYWKTGCWKNGKWDANCRASLLPKYRKIITLAKQKGMSVSAWGYHYGRNWLRKSQIENEVAAVLEAQRELGFTAYYIDAEIQWQSRNKPGDAAALCRPLKARGLWLALESFKWPSYHPEMRWEEWADHVDGWAPQVYWIKAHNAGAQTKRSIAEHRAIANLPLIPILPTFSEGGWQPTADEIREACRAADDAGVAGVGVWDAAWFRWQPRLAEDVRRSLALVHSTGFSEADVHPDVNPGETDKASGCVALKRWGAGDEIFYANEKVERLDGKSVVTEKQRRIPIADFLTSDCIRVSRPTPNGSGATHVVTAYALNVREHPALNARKVGLLRKGDRVVVIGTHGNWAKIGEKRWVYSRYLKEV